MPMSASTRSLQLISAAAVARRRWERRGTASAARSPRGQAPETSAEQRRAGVGGQNAAGVEGAPQLDRARQDVRPLGRVDLKVKLRAHDTTSIATTAAGPPVGAIALTIDMSCLRRI
jgi:hypothetical protein